MKSVFYASLAVVPWVVVTMMLRWLVREQEFPVGLVGTLSRAVTLPVLGLWIVAFGSGWRSLRPQGQGRWLALMGVISIVINILWFAAPKWTTVTNIGMLYRFDIVFVVLIGSALGLEKIGLRQLALIPVMFVGLALLMEIQNFDFGGHIVGDTMTVVAAFGLSVNAFVIRHIMVVMDEGPVAFYNHVASALGFLGLALVLGDFAQLREVLASTQAWVSIVVLGIVFAASLPLYYVALRRMDVWKLRMFLLTAPLLAAVVEWPLWGIELSPLQWLGGAIILVTLAALIRMEWRLSLQEQVASPAAPGDAPRHSRPTGEERVPEPVIEQPER